MRRDTQFRRSVVAAVVALFVLATGAGAQSSSPPDPHTLLGIGVEAYIYGYPLVMMGVTEQVTTNVSDTSTLGRAPINQFSNNGLPAGGYTDVVLPSTSTLYSSAWLDLRKEPVVLHLPDLTGRFYVMQVLDAWTNVARSEPNGDVIYSIGSRYGTQEGYYAFVGPDWNGTLPPGITRAIHLPTNTAWIIGRTFTTGTPDDIDRIVNTLFPQYTLTPLSSFGQSYVPPAGTVDPTVDMTTRPIDQVAKMDACAFFGKLAQLMMSNRPLPPDAATVAQFARIGLVPGQPFDCSKLDRRTLAALQQAVQLGQQILNHPPQLSPTTTGWSMPLGLGDYGTSYLLRALIARWAIGANYYADAIYGSTSQDADGQPLNGANKYVLHFEAGQLPPVNPRSFWSLTLYNWPSETLADNPIGRTGIGMPSVGGHQPCLNADGSMDLYVQADAPADPTSIQYCNWIPAPKGEFELFLRMYWPDQTVIDGTWTPPAVKRVQP
jgi:hypothetical protein